MIIIGTMENPDKSPTIYAKECYALVKSDFSNKNKYYKLKNMGSWDDAALLRKSKSHSIVAPNALTRWSE